MRVGPEVEIINRSLLISHIDVEGKQIYGGERAPAQNFEEGWKPIAIVIGLGRRCIRYFRHFVADLRLGGDYWRGD